MPWHWQGRVMQWYDDRPAWSVCMVLEPGLPSQPSALAVVEPTWKTSPVVHVVRHLERFVPGTPFPTMAERVIALLNTPELEDRTLLLIDRTGVGKSVYAMLQDSLCGRATGKIGPVHVTAGNNPPPSGLWVPRRELAGTLQVLLQTQRLKVAPTLPLAEVLVRELENFTVRPPLVTEDDLAAWRQSAQDDLVLAVGIAAWMCETVAHKSKPAGRR